MKLHRLHKICELRNLFNYPEGLCNKDESAFILYIGLPFGGIFPNSIASFFRSNDTF